MGRHAEETADITDWLDLVIRAAARDYDLALEIDPRSFDIRQKLRELMSALSEERTLLEDRRFEALQDAQREIMTLMWLAALTGLGVATATFLGGWRRLRQVRRAAVALRYQAALATHVSDALVATTTEGVVTSWNPSAETVYGHYAADAIGRPIHELVGAPLEMDDRLGDLVQAVRISADIAH